MQIRQLIAWNILLFLIGFPACAIELNISPSKDMNVSNDEMEIIKQIVYKKNHIMLTNNAAKKYIIENRKLSDSYLKKYAISKNVLLNHKLTLEEELANEYVKKHESTLNLSEETLKSYYIAHKSEFIKPKNLEFYPIKFQNFDVAMKFFLSHKNNIASIESYIKNKKIEPVKLPITEVNFAIRDIFKIAHDQTLLPPVFYRGSFIVFYVSKIFKKSYLPYKKAKQKIKEALLKKAFLTQRNKLLEGIGN